ncbi:uncharacterized protein G2W53_017702 [Senna tora]|uniref:Uncharacterized protein n=1 Tax=Senna tora TaxID=362788 RepID=A0A834TQF2_9FABA|nr:uncharacterized protein G2W53_017702 [Senna tora]
MDQRYCAFLYRDGNICQGSNGVAFEGQQPLGVIIREGINFEGLKQLIIQKLCLANSEENDEHVEMTMMTHNVYAAVINVMELLVETRAIRFHVDLNIESQSLLEDVPLSIPSWSQPEMPSAYYQSYINFDNTPNIEMARGLMAIANISSPHVRDDIGCSSHQTRIDVADVEALSFDSNFLLDEEADAIGPQVVWEYHEHAASFMSNICVERLVETDKLFAETESMGVELAEGAMFEPKKIFDMLLRCT